VPSDQFVVVLTTFPVDRDVEQFAKTLVEERLAACVNVLPPMRSIYAWKGAIERADERQLLIKTNIDRVRDLETRIKALHPYDVPEFLVISVLDGNRDYLSWVADSTKA
jgi:periplasmic divalent cation tolerance protein